MSPSARATAAFALFIASSAAAQGDVAQALFEDGKRLMREHDYPAACSKLAESLKLEFGLGTLLYLAECHARNGQIASAWTEFRNAAALAAQRGDNREAMARRRMAELDSKVSKIVIVVESVPETVVRLDGTAIDASQWGNPIPTDPGSHTVKADAPGRRAWEGTAVVASAARVTIKVPMLEPVQAMLADHPTPQRPQPPSSPVVVSDAPVVTTQRAVGIGVAGVGVIGFAIGTALGVAAKSRLDFSNDGHCTGNVCDAEGVRARSDALDIATGSTVAFALGAVALGAGAVIFFTAPRKAQASLAAAPVAGGGIVLLDHTW